MFSDLPGYRVGGKGSIPPELCITLQKSDIVIQDQKNKEKSDKYAHFVTDMTGYKCQVTCFEIGSRGYISPRNHSALYTLHKFTKPGTKLPKFKENISALSVYSSYHIFITRKEELFVEPPYLLPPFQDQ